MKLPARIAGTFIVRALAAAGSLALAALLVRAYSLGKFGEFSFAYTSVRLVGAMCLFSLDSLLLRVLLRGQERGGRLAGSAVAATAGLARIVAIAGFVLVAVLAVTMQQWRGADGFWTSLALLSPIVVLQGSAALQASILRAQRRDAWSQAITFTLPAVLPLAVVGTGWAGGSLPPFLPEIAVLAAHIVAVAIGWRLTGLGPLTHAMNGARRFAQRRLKVLRYSGAIHGANVMNYAADWYSALLITLFASFEVTGVLRILQQFGAAFGLLAVSLEVPFSSEIARAHIARKWSEVKRLLRLSQAGLAAIGAVLAAAIVAGSDLIFALFDLPPEPYRLPLFVLVGCYVLVLATGAAASALNIMDCTARLVRSSAIALVLAFVLQTALVPFFGLTGAVLGIGLTVLAKAGVNYLSVRAELRSRQASAQ